MNLRKARYMLRNLRYRVLAPMIGERILIDDRERIAAETEALVRRMVSPSCEFVGPEQAFLEGQIAKYGILDLTFSAPWSTIETGAGVEASLLRELGLASPQLEEFAEESEREFDEIAEALEAGKAYVLLFFQTRPRDAPAPSLRERVAMLKDPTLIPFPVDCVVTDACATNAPDIWLCKHFYL